MRAIDLSRKYKTLLTKYGLTTAERLAMFFAQLDHESGLRPIEENLNYTAKGLLKTFPKYFNTNEVDFFAKNPKKIANRVYANRMGNGNSASNDGYNYRGRGFIQLTGRYNYHSLSRDVGIDFVNNPHLLLEEANAMLSALWFWNKNKLNAIADSGDVTKVTKVINGGTNGLKDRKQKYDWYLKVFRKQ